MNHAARPSRYYLPALATCVVLLLVPTGRGTGPLAMMDAAVDAPGASFTVNSDDDDSDANPGDGVCETAPGGGVCTLRAAIEETNALAGPDTIEFDDSVPLVIPDDPLPSLADGSGGTTIKGDSTWILGTSAGAGATGLNLVSDDNKLQGLLITNFSGSGVLVRGDDNVIGTDGDGVDDDSEGNIISDSGQYGVEISFDGTRNWVAGNLIGLSIDGQRDVGNALSGVVIYRGAHANVIGTNGDGTSDELERNVISGNDQSGVHISGAGADQNTVAGNYIGTNTAGDTAVPNGWSGVDIAAGSADNLVGTDGDGVSDGLERNVISGNEGPGVRLDGRSSANVVAGNYIGTNGAGDGAIPNDEGILIQGGSTSNLIGTDADGTGDAAERNVISGNSHHGVYLNAEGTEDNVVAGNYVGTDAAGNAAVPNGDHGVQIQACADNRIGGTLAAERNVLSGNGFSGVSVYFGATGNLVQGNAIGTDADGSGDLGNGEFGVDVINSAVGNVVGGTASGAGNLIAFNGAGGIRVHEFKPEWHSANNSLRGNAIFSNGELGIDLSPEEGVTPNDAGDGDEGANNLQNFPVLSTAASAGSHLLIEGALNSASSTTFQLDFYLSSSCDPSGYGEGETYLGSGTATTDGDGDASFTTSLPASVSQGQFATATATDPNGNTSEFSLCLLVSEGYAIHLPLVRRD